MAVKDKVSGKLKLLLYKDAVAKRYAFLKERGANARP